MTLKPDMSNELRSMVREVLRDVMASRSSAPSETVRIVNNQDLCCLVTGLVKWKLRVAVAQTTK